MSKRNIFDLFKRRETYSIVDDKNDITVPVLFRALDHAENVEIMTELEKHKIAARKKYDNDEIRAEMRRIIKQGKREDIVKMILVIEGVTAQAVIDLAPAVEKEETKADQELTVEEQTKKKEESAMDKWRTQRETELAEISDEVLLEMLVNRQVEIAINGDVNLKFAELAVVKMALDPENESPLFSHEPKDHNWVGRLMPETRKLLFDRLNEFMNNFSEKNIRKATQDPAFLGSGQSESASVGSPGVTVTQISGPSQPQLSPSTPTGSG